MPNENELKESYECTQHVAQRFCIRLSEQVGEILSTRGITLAVPLEYRVKTWDSLAKKVEAAGSQISDVRELNDLIGLRVILLFRRDVDAVMDLLKSHLEVFATEDVSDRLGVQGFGYQSVHCQIRLPKTWSEVPTFREFAGLQAEVQIRTATQHIWAAASHLLQYKRESSVPQQVLRSINRVAALLETVDLEFERVLQERKSYIEEAPSLPTDEPLNSDLVRALLDEILPAANKDAEEEYDAILEHLQNENIRSARDLRELAKEQLDSALARDKAIADAARKAGSRVAVARRTAFSFDGVRYAWDSQRVANGVFFTHMGLIRKMLKQREDSASSKHKSKD